MRCSEKCPRGLDNCLPESNIVAHDNSSFVCVGLHKTKKEQYPEDIFRHCFVSAANTDSMYDYDEYDMKSVIAVMSNALVQQDFIIDEE